MLLFVPKDAIQGKCFPLTLSADYVSNWTVVDAVRELFQNMLDAHHDGYRMTYACNHISDNADLIVTEGRIWLQNENTHLPIQTLLLGNSTSRNDEEKIGQFGEGYKLALLILARAKVNCIIQNGDYIWVPEIMFNDDFQCDMLHIVQYNNPHRQRHNDLTFSISGLSGGQYYTILKSNLHLQRLTYGEETDAQKIDTENGTILLSPTYSGLIFVNGLFVTNLSGDGIRYGYDFKPGHIVLNRDRNMVSMWEATYEMLRMWTLTRQFDRIAEMLENDVKDVSYAGDFVSHEIKNACHKRFNELHGAKAHPVDCENTRAALGPTFADSTKIVPRAYYGAITGSSNYNRPVKEVAPPRKTPVEIACEILYKHLPYIADEIINELTEVAEQWEWKKL